MVKSNTEIKPRSQRVEGDMSAHRVIEALPPLQDGEELDQPTFHARYEAMPEKTRAELIDGKVYLVPSPVSRAHSRPHMMMAAWLAAYEAGCSGVEGDLEPTLILGARSELQPDLSLIILPSYGGRGREESGYLHTAPELVVEIGVSTARWELTLKKAVYARAGANEYLVILPDQGAAHWFTLQDGEYQALGPGEDGVLRSRRFPGLWLTPDALFDQDMSGLRSVLHRGLASDEHRECVEALESRRC
jgi:Uma2 family endonuclease